MNSHSKLPRYSGGFVLTRFQEVAGPELRRRLLTEKLDFVAAGTRKMISGGQRSVTRRDLARIVTEKVTRDAGVLAEAVSAETRGSAPSRPSWLLEEVDDHAASLGATSSGVETKLERQTLHGRDGFSVEGLPLNSGAPAQRVLVSPGILGIHSVADIRVHIEALGLLAAFAHAYAEQHPRPPPVDEESGDDLHGPQQVEVVAGEEEDARRYAEADENDEAAKEALRERRKFVIPLLRIAILYVGVGEGFLEPAQDLLRAVSRIDPGLVGRFAVAREKVMERLLSSPPAEGVDHCAAAGATEIGNKGRKEEAAAGVVGDATEVVVVPVSMDDKNKMGEDGHGQILCVTWKVWSFQAEQIISSGMGRKG